jgi:hypothetical protein
MYFRITHEFLFVLRSFRNLKFNGFFILMRIFLFRNIPELFVCEYWAHQYAPFLSSLCMLCVQQGTPVLVVSICCVIRYCTCIVVILAKVVLRARHVYVLDTSGIASYEALQTQSFMKPWYCLSVQSHVSYFANIIC